MANEENFRQKYTRSSTSYDEMNLTEKIKKVILSPSEFFERIKVEKGVGEAFKYLAILSLVNLVVGVVSFMLSIPSLSPLSNFSAFLSFPSAPVISVLGIVIPVAVYVGSLALSFVEAGFVHLFVKLFKGRGDYSATYKAIVYAGTPSILLGWIPFVGIIFYMYSFYLFLKGISKLHFMK
jgi:hypothetical protein